MTNNKAVIGLLIATIGSGITTALAFQAAGSMTFIILTIIAAALTPLATYYGVYRTANYPKVTTNQQAGTTP